MAALVQDTGYFVKSTQPSFGMKKLLVSTINTVDSSDTLTVDLAKYGWGSMCGIIGWTHTTENSVAIQEQPTTTMSGSTLTITVGGASNDQVRHYLIFLGPTKNA
jgi:phosphosulfolactate synthase (CoM biosynthesis protein A)